MVGLSSDANQPTRELQAVAAALVTLMVTVAPLANVPTWEVARRFLGSELTLRIGADLMGAVLAAGFVGAAALAAPLSDEARGFRALLDLIAHWSLPMLWALAMWMVAANLGAALVRAGFAIVAGVGLGLLMRLSEPRSCSDRRYEATLFVDLATYAAVLALLTILQAAHLRSALSATSTVLLTTLSALGLLCRAETRTWETLAASVTVGMLLGQLTWALNYCPVAPATAGGLLLIGFYALVGILRHALRDELRPHHVVEFALVGLAGIALIVFRGQIWGG